MSFFTSNSTSSNSSSSRKAVVNPYAQAAKKAKQDIPTMHAARASSSAAGAVATSSVVDVTGDMMDTSMQARPLNPPALMYDRSCNSLDVP
jgi:hypothetical protein